MFNFLSKISLSSWDEAWYGVIASNILKSGDLMNLVYNGKPFFDHPPFVFWLQAISIKAYGISEFSVRLPSFLLGAATLGVLYLVGKELFGKLAGLFASLALATSPWFLTRSLSGNLDIPLTFLFLLSFYFALKVAKNSKFLIPLSVSLSFLFLTKSLVPFTILPVLFFALWRKVNHRSFLFAFLFFILLVSPWFIYTQFNHPEFISKYLSIGYPGVEANPSIWQNVLLTKVYLHNGIGNWFYPGFLGLVGGFIFYRKRYLPVIIFVVTFLLPFAFSNKGHIWHLIPLHPFWVLSLFGFIELANNNFSRKIRFIIMTVLFLLISLPQIKRNWYEIVKAPPYTTDLEILSTKSQEYNLPLFLDDDAVPEVLFYSQKERVERIKNRGDIREMFNSDLSFQLVTRDWRLKEEKIEEDEYELVANDRDKVLILKK